MPYFDSLGLKLSVNIVKISGSLDGCSSKLEEAFICIGIFVPLYQESGRLGTHEHQKEKDDGGNYRGRQEYSPTVHHDQSTEETEKYSTGRMLGNGL